MRVPPGMSRGIAALLAAGALFAVYWAIKDPGSSEREVAIHPVAGSELDVARSRSGQEAIAGTPSVANFELQDARQADEREATEPESIEPSAEMQTGRALSLLVHVRESFWREAEAVAGVRVVAGVGRGALESGSPPIAQIAVLGEGRSNSEGDVHLDVVIPPKLENEPDRPPLVLFAKVDEEGYLRRSSGIAIPAEDVDRCEFTVQARKGATLEGLVLGSEGEPVKSGRIVAFQNQPSGDLGRKRRADIQRDGHFEVHLPQGGRWNIRAWTPNVGAAVVRNHLVSSDPEQRVVTLQLEGSGVLAGHVTDPAGTALARYKLWAVPGGQSEATAGSFNESIRVTSGSDRGTYDGHVETDDRGDFRFSGLAEGSYFIRGTLGGDARYGALLTPKEVHTGSEELQLKIARFALEVTFRGEDGLPVEAVPLSYPAWETLSSCTYYVHESDGQGHVLDPVHGVRGQRTRLEDGSYSIEVQPSKHYILGALSAHQALIEQEIFVDPSHFARKVSIDLAFPQESGSLKLEVLTPDGEPLVDRSRVFIVAPSGRKLFHGDTNGEGSEYDLVLAPDRYHGRISAPPYYGIHGGRFSSRKFMPVEFDATINQGFETRFPIRLGAGGWVRFSVTLKGTPGPVVTPTIREGDSWAYLRDQLRGVSVEFLPSDGGPALTALFDHSDDFHGPPMLGGNVENTWLVPGRSEKIIDALPVGSYEVHLWRDGYAERRVPVVIESEKTVDLDLVLNPSD